MAYKLIPEIALSKILTGLLLLMKVDYQAQVDKTNSILDDLFKDIIFDKFNFYDQAVNLFTKPKDERRRLEISMGYNLNRATMPTIHIILPSEQPKTAPIGGNEGYEPNWLGIDDNGDNINAGVFTYENQVTYNLLITSDNVMEVILLYNWLKYMFVSIYPHMELSGFRNLMFGGSDLNFDDSLIPNNAFHRNFNMNFEYEYSARDIAQRKIATGFIIEGIMKAPDEHSIEEYLRERQPFNS